jgi:hypothetical protein
MSFVTELIHRRAITLLTILLCGLPHLSRECLSG